MLNAVPGIEAEDGKWCIKFPNQAQFHILLYLKGLAEAFTQLGGKIYTQNLIFKDGIRKCQQSAQAIATPMQM